MKARTGRVSVPFLEDYSMPELLATLCSLPPNSLVFYSFFSDDKTGRFFEYDDSAPVIAQATLRFTVRRDRGRSLLVTFAGNASLGKRGPDRKLVLRHCLAERGLSFYAPPSRLGVLVLASEDQKVCGRAGSEEAGFAIEFFLGCANASGRGTHPLPPSLDRLLGVAHLLGDGLFGSRAKQLNSLSSDGSRGEVRLGGTVAHRELERNAGGDRLILASEHT